MNRGDAFTLTAAAVAGLVIGWYYIDKQPGKASALAAPAIAAPTVAPVRPSGLLYLATDKNDGIWQLDADSVSGPREKRQGWVVVDSSRDKTTQARSSKALYLIDRDTTASRVLKTILYDANGQVLTSATGKADEQPDYYAPGSMGYTVVKNVCEPAFDPSS